MAGKPRQKVFCQGITRLGNPCKAKGFLCLNGKWLCRFHGYQNKQGYLKPRFTKESKIKMLKTLYQFRNYTDNDFEKYYQEKIIPRLNNRTVNTIEGELISGKTLTEIFSEKNQYQVSLQKFYAMLKTKS